MKTLLIASCFLAAAAGSAFASELHYLPGGQPTCQYEEQEGCSIGHKTADETPAQSPQADCFSHELAVFRQTVGNQNSITGEQVEAVAALCKAPASKTTDCFNQAIAAAAKQYVSIPAKAIVRMCLGTAG